MVLELLGTSFTAENARGSGKQDVEGDGETDEGQIESLPETQLGHIDIPLVLGHFEQSRVQNGRAERKQEIIEEYKKGSSRAGFRHSN